MDAVSREQANIPVAQEFVCPVCDRKVRSEERYPKCSRCKVDADPLPSH
jgi:tRNA(Ile2) C34 agmatinyltransferase TiaS